MSLTFCCTNMDGQRDQLDLGHMLLVSMYRIGKAGLYTHGKGGNEFGALPTNVMIVNQ